MKKIWSKFSRSRITSIMLIVVATVLIVLFSFSHAMFTNSVERRGSLNIVTGNLVAHIESPYLNERNQITLQPGESIVIPLRLTNVNNVSARLNLFWWTEQEATLVSVGILDGLGNLDGIWVFPGYGMPTDEWDYYDEGSLLIINEECFPVTFNFGATAGLANVWLDFPEDKNKLSHMNWGGGGPGGTRPIACPFYMQSRLIPSFWVDPAFWQDQVRTNITTIQFDNEINIPTNAISTWDVSRDQNETVKAFIINDSNNPGGYKLHIQANGVIFAPENSWALFSEFRSLVDIINIELFDTSNVISMNHMFAMSDVITTMNLSSFDTSSVVDMSYMFFETHSLRDVDVSTWDTSNVVDMSWMFQANWNLSNLNVSNWDTSSVRDMEAMFMELLTPISIDVSNWNTSNVRNMDRMFESALGISVLAVDDWDTSNVTHMSITFGNTRVNRLNFSNWNTSQVVDMGSILWWIGPLRELTFGNDFHIPPHSDIALNPVLNNATYTGFWINSSATMRLTSEQLISHQRNNPTADTWRWERR